MDRGLVLAGSAADWGDVPTWLSSIATVLALLFAAVAAVAAHRAYRIESERDRIAAEERRRQEAFLRRTQAALVSAWWGWQPSEAGGERAGRWGAFVRNASETPVYQASLTMLDIHDPDVSERLDLAIVPPGAEPVFYPSGLSGPPGGGDRAGQPSGGWLVQDGQHAVDYRVEIAFTDSAGVRWIRDQQGRLSELRPEVLIWADERRAGALPAVLRSGGCARDLPGMAQGARRLPAPADHGRGGPAAGHRAHRPVRPAGRAGSGVQLRVPVGAVVRAPDSGGGGTVADRDGRSRTAAHLGHRQP